VALCRLGTRFDRKDYSGQRVKKIEAAKIIQLLGIKPSDYILLWHRTFQDYSALRHQLISTIGEQAVNKFLPPQSHVIRLNYLFKHNLGKLASISLELLFRWYFPTHPLSSTHHDAEVDTLKLSMMAQLGEDFCRGNGKVRSKVLDWVLGDSLVET
jgi:hypothetical protein